MGRKKKEEVKVVEPVVVEEVPHVVENLDRDPNDPRVRRV